MTKYLRSVEGFFDGTGNFWFLVARVALASPFLLSGVTKLLAFFQSVPSGDQSVKAVDFLATYLSQSFPFFGILAGVSPKLVVAALLIAGIVEVVAGVFIALGAWTKLSSLVLILYTFLVSLVFHYNWSLSTVDGQLQLVTFIKNMGLIGGFLMLLVRGAGSWSVDALLSQKEMPVAASMSTNFGSQASQSFR